MKFYKGFYIVFLLLIGSSFPGFCQSTDTISLNSIITKTGAFAENYPQEKVHLHFDKPYYAVGDTIWFKAYVTSGLHVPSQLSKIVYVDIIKGRDSLVQSLKLPVTNGLAWGNFNLTSNNYQQGNYHVRAYTRWMVNFDPAYLFNKTVYIGNSENPVTTNIQFTRSGNTTIARIAYKTLEGVPFANKKVSWEIYGSDKEVKGKGITDQKGLITITLPAGQPQSRPSLNTVIELDPKSTFAKTFEIKDAYGKIDLQFFPEGGDLVSEIPSKVAFKAIRPDGLGIEIKGNITDNDGKVVAEFASQHLGMGAFTLIPEAGKTYKASITSPAGYTEPIALPAVNESGIKLSVTNTTAGESLGVRFICNTAFLLANQSKSFYLVAKVGEVVCYAAQTVLQKQLYIAPIPKNKFPTGIVQITLFDSKGQPLSERLAFVQQPDLLGITLKSDKPVYGRRQKVKLDIAAKNGAIPAEANLSLSVIDESKVHPDENTETTILSNFLLTSDLKGFIEKPNYYFNRPSEKTAADLDILMMTQGYRRFTYQDILSTPPKVIFGPEQGIEISGTLRNSTGMPIFKGNVRLSIPDKSYSAYTTTNSKGVFKFSNLSIADSLEAVITSADYQYKNPMLTIDPMGFQPSFNSMSSPADIANIDSTMETYLQNNKKIFKNSHMLKDVVITAKAPASAPSHSDYPTLSGLSMLPDRLIKADQLTGCNVLLMCLQSNLSGVTYRDENFYITRDFNAGSRTPMQVFYNGMPVDMTYLNGVNPADVDNIEIFLKDQLGLVNRNYNSNGAIVINGKKVEKQKQMSMAEIKKLLPKPGELKFMPQGYSAVKEFYSPQYSAQTLNTGADLRTTIYWNPKIRTDKTTGASSVEFFNADGRGTYTAIIEGIDAEGHIGRSVYRYKVQ